MMAGDSFNDGVPWDVLLTVDVDALPEIPIFTSAAAAANPDATEAVDYVRLLMRLAAAGSQPGVDRETSLLRGAQMVALIRGVGEWERGMALIAALDILSGLWAVVSHAHTPEEIELMGLAAGYGAAGEEDHG